MMPDPHGPKTVDGGLSDADFETFGIGHGDADAIAAASQDLPDLSGWNVLQSEQDAMSSGGLGSLNAHGSLDPISQFDDFSILGPNLTAATDDTVAQATEIDDTCELGPSFHTELDENTGTFPGEGLTAVECRSDVSSFRRAGDVGHGETIPGFERLDSCADLDADMAELESGPIDVGTHDKQSDFGLSMVSCERNHDESHDEDLVRLAVVDSKMRSSSSRDSLAADVGVQRAFEQLKPEMPKYFWESSTFLRQVFGTDPFFPSVVADTRPPMPIDVEAPVSVRELLKRPRSQTTTSLCERTLKFYPEKEDRDRRMSIVSDWASLVAVAPMAFRVGRFIDEDKEDMTHANIRRSVEMCFTGKATSTLAKRFYSINRFLTWCVKSGACPFPVRERDVLRHLEDLDSAKSAPSSGRSLLEAIRFSAALLGMDEDLSTKGQTRVQGLATKMALRAGPIVQAAPLTVAQVCKLERLVVESEDFRDKVTLGGILILLYSCGRISDGQRAVEAIFDGDMADINHTSSEVGAYYELQVVGNKAARSETLKRSILPLVAPVFSMANVAWFNSWAQARSICGLPVSGKLTQPFLCRFGAGGDPMDQALSASEVGAFLRAALGVEADNRGLVRSHSLKCTALSWSAKYGLDLPTRRLLGHHLDPGATSAETYSRDSMAPALRSLERVLRDIKTEKFFPDKSRSGRFARPSVETAKEVAGKDDRDGALDESDSDSDYNPSTDSDDTGSDDSAAGEPNLLWHVMCGGLKPEHLEVGDDVEVYRHVVSGVQHLALKDAPKLLCGRRLHERYVRYAGLPLVQIQICETCKNHRQPK